MEIGQSWRESFLEKLQGAFGGNLLFAGLQGSRARGEAGPQSDIDLVVVLEQVEEREISAYRELLASMEGGGLACGFLCGRRELAAWPRYDSLTLLLDTVPWYGSLQPLLPPFSPQDAEEAVRIAAAGLYHAACHSLLFSPDKAQAAEELRKPVFFLLRARLYRVGGRFFQSRRDLLPEAEEEERALLAGGPSGEACLQAVLRYCSGLLRRAPR